MLTKAEGQWKFETEADLEDFVWTNLETLLDFQPLKRQHYAKGEPCDILAVADNQQLAILELKNVEDRYIVQQLTRYYDNLLDEQPFQSEIDYSKPTRLIAIAPSFHRHNFLDLKYHHLNIEFLLFEIIQEGKKLYFHLTTPEGKPLSRLQIPFPEERILDESAENIPSPRILPRPPKALLRSIEHLSPEKQDIIWNIREKILRFDERLGEKSTDVTITYGRQKSKGVLCKTPSTLCAGFCSPSRENHIELFLYLPFPKKTVNQGIMKIAIINDENWQTVLRVKIPSRHSYPWTLAGHYLDIEDYFKLYEKITNKKAPDNSVDALIDLALKDWLERR